MDQPEDVLGYTPPEMSDIERRIQLILTQPETGQLGIVSAVDISDKILGDESTLVQHLERYMIAREDDDWFVGSNRQPPPMKDKNALFYCPICRGAFDVGEVAHFVCPNKHVFEIALNGGALKLTMIKDVE